MSFAHIANSTAAEGNDLSVTRVKVCSRASGVVKEQHAPVIFNRVGSSMKATRLEARLDERNTVVGLRSVDVSADEMQRICDDGYPVEILELNPLSKQIPTRKSLPPLQVLPSSFTIYRPSRFGIPGPQYGDFWVPANMPSGHTYQITQFMVTPSNFAASGTDSHLVVSTLTVSNSNFSDDFDGKGAIFYPNQNVYCGSNRTMLQSWAMQGYSGGQCPGCVSVVFNGNAPSPWNTQPNSCGSWNAVTPKRFLVGANIWQDSVYWRCVPNGTCPEFASPTVNSYTPQFRSGGAGIAFFVAATSNAGWSLAFDSVISYTGPRDAPPRGWNACLSMK
jgi:hypothetical protein